MAVDPIQRKLNQSEPIFINRIDIRYVASWDEMGFYSLHRIKCSLMR
jgi:hypothetical protein